MQDEDRTFGSDRTLGTPGHDSTLQPVPTGEAGEIKPGTMLAGRYQIIDTLGVGGMGAVYKAFDKKLTRVVALKTILAEFAATPTALKRFKQELLLAQQIVHKNVVRIFDIGEDGETKFITMDFIEGDDLKSLIKARGKLAPQEAVAIIRQVCQGLEAAHAAGVVHRDLKPQNIMVQGNGLAMVMDFGVAQSSQNRNVTQTGAFLGTPEYMSPEQAKTEDVDLRSDIFSLGLILYEMLTGRLPYQADTVIESMFKRTRERAIPPAEIDRDVPKMANDIIVKCLELERERRYQSVSELLNELETFDPTKKVGVADRAKVRLRKAARYRNWAAATVLVVIALAVGFMISSRFAPAPATAHAPVTVVVADFSNHTSDTIFDGALEPVVKMALEGAGFITAYDRTQMRTLGLPAVSGKLDETAARKIAVGQGLGIVLTGSLDQKGAGFVLSMKAAEAVTGNIIWNDEETASKKDDVLFAATKLAGTVRKALGDDTSESASRFAMETLSATSLEAIHDYATAMDELSNAKYEDALKSFSKAVDVDPNFGLAYAGMATASRNLGQQQDGEKFIKLALGHLDRMTERERYRIRGAYYAILGDSNKCVEEYTTLISRFPSDAAAHNNVATCNAQLRNMQKSLEHARIAASILPKRFLYRFNLSLYSSYVGDFQTAERDARASQELDPSNRNGLIALAWAQMGQGQSAQVSETYKKLETMGKLGASEARTGQADLATYEGRFADAVRILEQGAAEDLANQYSDRAATKFAALAYTRLLQEQEGAAVAAAERALALSKAVKIQFLAGRVLAATGKAARARALAAGLGAELQTEPQTYAKLLEGESALASGDARGAIKAFTEANNLLDTWIGRFGLGRAYLAAGAFAEADSEFDRCIKRRGEALAFLDDAATYGHFPSVYYYLGRVREGLKSTGFADSYRTYLSIRDTAGEDPLLPEIRKRTGS